LWLGCWVLAWGRTWECDLWAYPRPVSKWVGVESLGGFFWAYDVSLAVVVAQFLDVAVERGRWLEDEQRLSLGRTAFLGAESGLDVEADLVAGNSVDDVVGLLTRTVDRLRERQIISSAEADAWRVLEDETILWRGGAFETEPAARLGEVLIDAVLDRLPTAPAGRRWHFGWPDLAKTTLEVSPGWPLLHHDAVKTLEAWQPSAEADAAFWDTLELLKGGWETITGGAVKHLTVSAVVVAPDRRRVLLCLDRRSGLWFHPAGHCEEADDALADAARRWAKEQSGIIRLRVDRVPIHVAVRQVTCGGRPSTHFDVAFVAYAPEGAEELVSDESYALVLLTPDELPSPLDAETKTTARAALRRASESVS
jgi:8-oxo-dGTP pyrophosphatase MutT (NUDIX family)